MTFDEALRLGIKALKKHRCSPHAGREAEELLCFSARTERETLLAHPERHLAPAVFRRFNDALNRRLRHEPVEYITGRTSFFGRTFRVSKDTLIPRPATELLIEALLDSEQKAEGRRQIIDAGTGSGCIAATLALELPSADIIATDMSTAALRIARTNAKHHGVSSRIRFYKTDLLPPLPLSPSSPLPLSIIANLPYIPTAAMKKLPPDVRLHEPRQALEGGKDGLDYYRRLLALFPSPPLRLSPTSLFLELLPAQYAPLEKAAKKTWPGCRTKKILNGNVTIGIEIKNRP